MLSFAMLHLTMRDNEAVMSRALLIPGQWVNAKETKSQKPAL